MGGGGGGHRNGGGGVCCMLTSNRSTSSGVCVVNVPNKLRITHILPIIWDLGGLCSMGSDMVGLGRKGGGSYTS